MDIFINKLIIIIKNINNFVRNILKMIVVDISTNLFEVYCFIFVEDNNALFFIHYFFFRGSLPLSLLFLRYLKEKDLSTT